MVSRSFAGLYVTSNNDLYDATLRAQANTWYAPGDFTRFLFVYTAATKKLEYWVGDPSSNPNDGGYTYAKKSTLTISQSMIDGQDITGGLNIGKPWTGTGGAGFSGFNWHGGFDNLIGSSVAFSGPHIQEYYENQSTDPDDPQGWFKQTDFYDDLDFYCKMGEDVYPEVSDEKGLLTNGVLVNGTAEDFKDIPGLS